MSLEFTLQSYLYSSTALAGCDVNCVMTGSITTERAEGQARSKRCSVLLKERKILKREEKKKNISRSTRGLEIGVTIGG